MSAKGWLLHTNIAIEFSFKAAEWRLREALPGQRIGHLFNRERVFAFVRPALNWQWEGGADGGGRGGPADKPAKERYGREYVERYLPGYTRPVWDPAKMDEEEAHMLRRISRRGRQSSFEGEDWMVRMGICMTRHRGMCDCYN
jgi:hypothetical protein